MARGLEVQRMPRAGRWAMYIALAVAFAIACAFLSHWQFSRNEERSAQLALVEQNYDAAPLPVEQVLEGTDGFDPGDEWRPVVLVGEYLSDEELLVRNRAHGGTSAYEVLTPLRLSDGRVFLVDRGWIMPGESSDAPDVVPEAPTGIVAVTARLRPGEELPRSGRSAPEGQLPTIHLPLAAESTGPETITSAYGLMVSEDPAPPARPTALESPTADPGPYLSYAIQWILFAVMGFVFIGYVIRTEIRARREDAADAAAAATAAPESSSAVSAHTAAPAPRRPRRRKDADADAEDALIDAQSR